MPKVSIDNTKGLVQSSGGGLALFGAIQSLTAAGSGSQPAIKKETSLALCTSTNNAHIVDLPAIADVDLGHTILIASVGAADVVINTPSTETINGAATITTGEATAVLCVKATASTWVAVIA